MHHLLICLESGTFVPSSNFACFPVHAAHLLTMLQAVKPVNCNLLQLIWHTCNPNSAFQNAVQSLGAVLSKLLAGLRPAGA